MRTTKARPTILVVEHETDGGPDLMGPVLQEQAALTFVRPFLGEPLPETADGLNGLVVLGGSMGAGDDDRAPWLPGTRALIKDAVSSAVPVLGVCLGAQLLAAATGGRVERGAAGLELGRVDVTPLAAARTDPFFGPVDRALTAAGHENRWPVAQYHYDAVVELPPGAELLVTADRYPVQGFRVGPNAYGVQFHPEVSAAGFATWVSHGQAAGELPAEPAGMTAVSAATQRVVADALTDSLINMAVTNLRAGSRDTLSR